MAEEQEVETWTRLLQQTRDELANVLAALTLYRQNLDDFWDKLWEYRRVLDTSRELVASATPVSKDPVWTVVSGHLHELIEKTPDPQGPWVRDLLKGLGGMVRVYEALAWRFQQRVREVEEVLELLFLRGEPGV